MAEMKKNEAKETVKPVEKITAKADALKIETKEPEKTPAVKAAVKEPAEKKAMEPPADFFADNVFYRA